jgi:hypothetical protein
MSVEISCIHIFRTANDGYLVQLPIDKAQELPFIVPLRFGGREKKREEPSDAQQLYLRPAPENFVFTNKEDLVVFIRFVLGNEREE